MSNSNSNHHLSEGEESAAHNGSCHEENLLAWLENPSRVVNSSVSILSHKFTPWSCSH